MRPIRPPLGSSPDALETAVIDLPGSDTRHARATRDLVCRDFRDTLGSFATGVTVLTTLATDGKPVGLTISSFNTVSLDPPLILWSLACDSPRLAAFRHAGHYAVNVLAADQEVISNRFASRDEDRFDALAFTPGLAGVPLIQGCSAWFECSHEAHYPGGDHLIFLGRVQRFARGQTADPLIFHAGRYRRLHSNSER